MRLIDFPAIELNWIEPQFRIQIGGSWGKQTIVINAN